MMATMRALLRGGFLAILASVAAAAAALTESQVGLPHKWSRIVYPTVAPSASQQIVPSFSVSNDPGLGLRFDLIYTGGQDDRTKLPSDADIVVRLHRADGKVILPKPDGVRGPFGASTNGSYFSYDYIYAFPWQDNLLEEAWIECRFSTRSIWVEVPYGFIRNPADALTQPRTLSGRPRLAPTMSSMRPEDEILPWDYVSYELGDIQNNWRAEVHISNPFDAAAEVVLYRHDTAIGKSMYLWDLHTPQSRMEINDPLTRRLPSREVEIRLHDDGMRRSDFFNFYRNPGNDRRIWGSAVLTVEDQEYLFTLPSSLFRYTHGSPEYPKPPIPRSVAR